MAERFDYLVIGGGVAGLTFALRAARTGTVAVLTKRARDESNTKWAQGGIAAVLDPDDSFDAHVKDTIEAGVGLSHLETVELCVREAPERIRELVRIGVDFSERAAGQLDLTREGGHSARRVVHAKDLTGMEVERALIAACEEQPNIRFFDHHTAIDLILSARAGQPGPNRALGAWVLDNRTGDAMTLLAKVTILATGGAGKVYLYTSNPDVATGDGLAMAWRAGAVVANMEFYQFHPTCLFHPQAKSFLISEALRGEGGVLRRGDGTSFMEDYHSMGSLAPRDVVARAIDAEMKRTGDESVFLDMTHLPRSFLVDRFPNIYATCKEFGIDMAVQPIPVVPAAHYQCGGILVDLDARTSIPNLLAIGEVAATGLHGANRLASNSLLEGLVFGARGAVTAHELAREAKEPPRVDDWNVGSAVEPEEAVVVTHNWDEIRRLMWNYVGIVRTVKRLHRARARLDLLREEIRQYYWQYKLTTDFIEVRNIADVAHMVVRCALERKESRGLHYILDYPKRDDAHWRRDTVISRAG
ncbi:L-aspartate oxidase [Vulgatibacter sp.]|uniref:L-aspartate oxidase n=1 Tax=Vulgatibacter sp. TaxID=1971226 RepID=UPI00356A8489